MWRGNNRRWIGTEKGSVLLMVGAAMVVMLTTSAIAIDLVNLYLARTQAQRAADAAALAGATPEEERARRLQLKSLLFGMGETFRTLIQRKAGK